MKISKVIKRVIDNWKERIIINRLRNHLAWFGVAVAGLSDAELKACAHRAAKAITSHGVTVEQASKGLYKILDALRENTGIADDTKPEKALKPIDLPEIDHTIPTLYGNIISNEMNTRQDGHGQTYHKCVDGKIEKGTVAECLYALHDDGADL